MTKWFIDPSCLRNWNPLRDAGFQWVDAKVKDLPKGFVSLKGVRSDDLDENMPIRVLIKK